MLVLSRRYGQEIVIGSGENAIRVVVLEDSGNRVKLAIKAPREIPIHRGQKRTLDTTKDDGVD